MTENRIFNLGLKGQEVFDLHDILMEKIKKDFKGITTQPKNRLNHSIDVNNFRDLVTIYSKVTQIEAVMEEDTLCEDEASLPDMQ